MVIEKNSYIKLPYGLVSDENNKEKIRFNLPLNYKKDVLFQQVPYFAEANNPAIDDVVLGNKRDDLSIQKFLLSKGVLEDAVLDNLDMIVTDRKFNNAGIRRKLDLKYPSIVKKPTASNFLYRDLKQFNVQNPVIGGLYNQLQIKTSDQLKLLRKAPRIKDLKIRNALERLKKFNLERRAADDDDDNNDLPGLPPGKRPLLPRQDDDDDDDDDNDDGGNVKDNEVKKFLLDKGNERIAAGLAATTDGNFETRSVAFSKEITKLFPKVKEEELSLGPADVDEFKDVADLDFLDKTDKYDFPMKDDEEQVKPKKQQQQQQQQQQETLDIDLDFFAGGDKNSRKLMMAATSYIGELNPSNRVFLEYLSSNFGARLLTKNKLKIHLESGQFFHNNIITNESIYDFLLKQQDESKRELYPEVIVGNDFEFYVNELLANVQDNDYDLHTNSTSKFLLYNCNTLRLANRLKPISVRHSQIVTNEKAISILQSNTWGYFVEQLLHFASGNISLDDFNLDDDREFERYNVIEKTSDNVNYCKEFYQEVFDDIGYFFQRMIRETPDEFLEPLKTDLANEIYFHKNLKEIESQSELLRIFNLFYFKTGRFPGNYTDLILVPAGKNPSFVKSFDQISPLELNDKFQNTSCYGIAAVHFLAALNIFFGGEKSLSQDVMTELLHNLSYQALNFENTKVNIKFDQIIKLNKNLKSLIRDVDRSTINTIAIDDTAVDESKDRLELMEEELVNNVLSGKKVEIPIDFRPPMPDSPMKIQTDTNKRNLIKRKNDESLNQLYETINKDVVTSARNDLVKSVTDYEGEIPTNVINNITSSFKQNDPVNRSVRKHVKDSIKNRNQQYFKQKQPPSVVRKKTTTAAEPRIKITDIVNRNISRSSSFSSIPNAPLSEVEMISRANSLESVSSKRREYSDQEMISRPPSVSSIRDFNKSNNDLSFEPPLTPIYITDFSNLPPSTPPPPLKKEEKKAKQKGKIVIPLGPPGSRSGSLDSISTMKREYSDQEMISRPPSVASIRNFNKTIDNLSFEQPVSPVKKDASSVVPLNAAQKAVITKKNVKTEQKSSILARTAAAATAVKTSTTASRVQSSVAQRLLETAKATASSAVHPIVAAVRSKFSNENLNPAEVAVITRRKGLTPIPPEPRIPLNAAQKAVLAKKNSKKQTQVLPNQIASSSSSSSSTTTTPLSAAQKAIIAKRQKKINNPPTVSLIASIEKKSTIKKKTAAAKADSKIKRDELVARWQNKSDDVEMAIPLQTGKRKKSLPKFNPTGDPKYKKEN